MREYRFKIDGTTYDIKPQDDGTVYFELTDRFNQMGSLMSVEEARNVAFALIDSAGQSTVLDHDVV